MRHQQDAKKDGREKPKIDDILWNDVVITQDGRRGWVINPNSDGRVVVRSYIVSPLNQFTIYNISTELLSVGPTTS